MLLLLGKSMIFSAVKALRKLCLLKAMPMVWRRRLPRFQGRSGDCCSLTWSILIPFTVIGGTRKATGKHLEAFDEAVPYLINQLGDDDLLILTADHGNDPTYTGTDHTREYVPLLIYSPSLQSPQSIGVRDTFADVAATIADNFEVKLPDNGKSFLQQLV